MRVFRRFWLETLINTTLTILGREEEKVTPRSSKAPPPPSQRVLAWLTTY
jgi:hypothetical protein